MKTIVVVVLLVASALAGFEENRGIEDPDLFEGDIKLTEDQRAEIEARGDLERVSITTRLWPNGEVIYDVEPSIANEPRAMARLNEAIAEYRQKTCIRFKRRTTEAAYISVFKGSGCWSYVGRTGRKQQLSLAGGCWYKGIVIHEFAHALGFYHEQSRPDRDNFVTIKFENIQTGKEGNFRKHSSGVSTHGTTYDYGSVMHYSGRAFTKNGQPTIVPKKPGVTLGQRLGLSPLDTEELNKLYKCGNIPTPPPPVTPPPSGAFSCNFERDTCGFSQSKSDKFDWIRRSGATPSGGTGPTGDHTTGSGHYLYIETSSPRVKGDNAVVEKQVSLSGNDCLRFFYQMNGRDVATLNVYVGNAKVFTKSGSQGQPWKSAEVRLAGSGVQKIRFEGIRGNSWQGDIAIDDVSVTQCSGVPPTQPPTQPPVPPTQPPVPPTQPPSGFKCDFESNCGFGQRKDDKFDWTRRRGRTPSSQTGPSGDHTSGQGYYMYIETSSPRKLGDNAIIEKTVTIGSNQCLSFYYHMYGFHTGTLNVFVGGRKVFTKSKQQGNKWFKANVRLSQTGPQKLSFEGIRGTEYSGDIAIDDISIGRCGSVPTPPPPTQPPTPPVVTGTAPPQGACGIRPNTRIVGGTAAKHGDWPWQVQLRTTSGFPYCGGSLIHPQWILTATHCVSRKSPSSIVIRLGAHRRVNTVGTEQDIKVSKVITHPSYHKPKTYAHDIALLKLEKPALLNRHVNLVCLPETDPAPTDGKHCWITGWGRLSSGGATPDYLQQVSVPIASRARCDKAYPNKIHDSMICAGIDQGGIDSCQGDSGGPMVCENGGRFYIHGATSWGYGCAAPGKFGVYAKVKYLLPWIKGEMAKN